MLHLSSLSMNGLNQTQTAVFTLLLHVLLSGDHITIIYSDVFRLFQKFSEGILEGISSEGRCLIKVGKIRVKSAKNQFSPLEVVIMTTASKKHPTFSRRHSNILSFPFYRLRAKYAVDLTDIGRCFPKSIRPHLTSAEHRPQYGYFVPSLKSA